MLLVSLCCMGRCLLVLVFLLFGFAAFFGPVALVSGQATAEKILKPCRRAVACGTAISVLAYIVFCIASRAELDHIAQDVAYRQGRLAIDDPFPADLAFIDHLTICRINPINKRQSWVETLCR